MADYMLVFVLQKILSLTCLVVECVSQQQFGLIIGPHKQFWFPCTNHFHLSDLSSAALLWVTHPVEQLVTARVSLS